MKKKDTKPYTYVAYYRGIPVYVGKGTGDRLEHTNSGKSNNELLNEFYFRRVFLGDMPLVVHKVSKYTYDYLALSAEKDLIDKYLPYCNKCAGREHSVEYEFRGKLSRLCFDNGYTQPEQLLSKFDFRFLFTPKGLYCKSVYLDKRSPFEYAFNKYHIRLKKELLIHFPEFSLQFVDMVDEFQSQIVSNCGYGFFFKRFIEQGGNPFDSLSASDEWLEVAYRKGGFSSYYIPESKFKPKYKLDYDRYKYTKYNCDSHIDRFYVSQDDYSKAYRNHWSYKNEKPLINF